MKILKCLFAGMLLYTSFAINGIGLSSCKKDIINDTTVVIKTDTLIVNHTDTVTVLDSVYSITDGLVAYYNFNGGTLKDSSGYGNNIIFNNATPAPDRFGNPNNAYLFNGSSNYMSVNNSSSLNPNNTITLMAIVKINGFYPGACNVNQIVGKGIDKLDNGEYYLRFSDYITNSCTTSPNTNQETFAVAYNSIGVGSADTVFVKTDVWYNLIFTYDGFEGKLYINGTLKKTWMGFSNFMANANNLFIGAHEEGSHPYWFNGVIDEVRIYNRDLPYGAIIELNNLKE
jgi:hypothetical protein